jgi:hypothetical protein
MTEVLQIKHSESLIDSNWTKPKNWILSVLTGNLQKYRFERILKRVDYWWIEYDSNDSTIKRKIGFDKLKSPLSGLTNIMLRIDFKKLKTDYPIDSYLFNDVWNLYDKIDFDKLTQIHTKYLELWRQPNKIESPRFPSILIDLMNTTEIIKIDTVEQLINQSDFVGYEWTDSERLIDSKGDIYKTDYYNFGHPVGVVIPSAIDRRIDNSELTTILSDNEIEFKIDEQ